MKDRIEDIKSHFYDILATSTALKDGLIERLGEDSETVQKAIRSEVKYKEMLNTITEIEHILGKEGLL